MRTKRYKYIRYYDDYLKINCSNADNSPTKSYYIHNGLEDRVKEREALYDLLYDPGERRNLIANEELQTIAKGLREKLDFFQKKTEDPLLEGAIGIRPGWKVNRPECVDPSSRDPEDYV